MIKNKTCNLKTWFIEDYIAIKISPKLIQEKIITWQVGINTTKTCIYERM